MPATLKDPDEQHPYQVWKEDDTWIAADTETSVASQGDTPEEALENLQDALELYHRDSGVSKEELEEVEVP